MEIANNKLNNLSSEDMSRLIEMEDDYKSYCKIDSDQKCNNRIWIDKFSSKWGSLDEFISEMRYLKSNKDSKVGAENRYEKLKKNTVDNINEFRTFQVLFKNFSEKNIIKYKNHRNIFKEFCKRKTRQSKNKQYSIEKLISTLGLESYDDFRKLYIDKEIKSIVMEKATFIKGKAIEIISYMPHKKH